MTKNEIRKYAREWKRENMWRYRPITETNPKKENIAVLLHDRKVYEPIVNMMSRGYKKGWDKEVVRQWLLKRYKGMVK